MKGLDNLRSVPLEKVSPGELCIMPVQDRSYVSLVAWGQNAAGQRLIFPATLAEVGADEPPAQPPRLYPYPDWAKTQVLDLHGEIMISSSFVGRTLRDAWELGTPYGALVVMGHRTYLCAAQDDPHGSRTEDVFIDIRSGEMFYKLEVGRCYIVTHWSIAKKGPGDQWAYWINFDATKFIKK